MNLTIQQVADIAEYAAMRGIPFEQAALDADTLETTANVFLRLAINQQIELARRLPNGNLSQ